MKTAIKLMLGLMVLTLSLTAQTRNGKKMESDTLIMEGVYAGKNILIKNPYGLDGIGFCVFEVLVNGMITTDEINASTFQIKLDFPKLKLKAGDKVKVEMKYFKNCKPYSQPLVMNPGALSAADAGKMSTVTVNGKFMWANLFVANPRVPGTDSFSVKEVFVNGKKMPLVFNSDVFEINLTALGLQEKDKLNDGDKIKIEFNYQTGYGPIILNPEAVQ